MTGTAELGLRRVGVVGAGAMGRGIAQIAAQGGYDVSVFDSKAGAAEGAVAFAGAMIRRQAEKGTITGEAAQAACDRLTAATSLCDLAGCDLVIEAIIELLDAKQTLFRELETVVGESCILATNTSSLSVTRIAAGCERPQRLAGLHFFNPVPMMKVVEVIGGLRTDPAVLQQLDGFATAVGHRGVRASDTPGFLVNHAGRGLYTEGLRIIQEGVASAPEIDLILRESLGFRMGPFELLDLTGLDVSFQVMEQIYRQYYEEPRFRPSPLPAQRVSAGLYGRKSGEGFYRYDGDKRQPVPQADYRAAALRNAFWLGAIPDVERAAMAKLLTAGGANIDGAAKPSADALCLLAPLGEDATTAALKLGLDPARCIAIDLLGGMDRRLTLMAPPIVLAEHIQAMSGALQRGGGAVSIIADSPGFVAQRVICTIINIASDIAQQQIAVPADIDAAVRIGLGYPHGPLDWGDRIGPSRVMQALSAIHAVTGDPRYRVSPWLRRRAQLGKSLLHTDSSIRPDKP